MSWVNAIVQGILLGGFYALLACGLSLMFGVMRIINLAHGDLAVLGRLRASGCVADHTASSPFLALCIALPVMFGVGYALQRHLLERSLRAGVLMPLLTTFGLAIVIQNLLLRDLLARRPLARRRGRLDHHDELADLRPDRDLGARRADPGRRGRRPRRPAALPARARRSGAAMRATAQDADTRRARGRQLAGRLRAGDGASPSPPRPSAGVFLAIRATVDPASGPTQLIFAFEAVVIGGLRLALGDARRRDRARRRADDRRPDRPAVLDPRRPPRVPGGAGRAPRGGLLVAEERGRDLAVSGPAARVQRWTHALARVHGGRRGRRRSRSPSSRCPLSANVVAEADLAVHPGDRWPRCGTRSRATAASSRSASRPTSASARTGRSGSCSSGVAPYSRCSSRRLAAGVLSVPVSLLLLRLRGGQFAIAHLGGRRGVRVLVGSTESLGAGTGISLTRAQPLHARRPARTTRTG